jgi:hypothetical protein
MGQLGLAEVICEQIKVYYRYSLAVELRYNREHKSKTKEEVEL